MRQESGAATRHFGLHVCLGLCIVRVEWAQFPDNIHAGNIESRTTLNGSVLLALHQFPGPDWSTPAWPHGGAWQLQPPPGIIPVSLIFIPAAALHRDVHQVHSRDASGFTRGRR